jgi:SnoaL-like polyketide cyclase
MKGSDGKLIAPTNKKFHIELCTVAHWKNGEIVEEKLFYDRIGSLKQIGSYVRYFLRSLYFLHSSCFQYPTVKRCRTCSGRSSSSIVATA